MRIFDEKSGKCLNCTGVDQEDILRNPNSIGGGIGYAGKPLPYFKKCSTFPEREPSVIIGERVSCSLTFFLFFTSQY